MHTARFSLLAAAALLAACSDVAGPKASSAIDDLNASLAVRRDSDPDSDDPPTGGLGTAPASGLGSQGAVLLTPNNRVLLAVNAGSNQISSFAVGKAELKLAATVPSGGQRPVSVAATDHVVYALNNGSSTIAGFRIGHRGALTPVPGWTRS